MATFWEEFKDMFKTKSQRDEEKQDKLNNALEQEKQVVEQLKELEGQLEPEPTPEKPNIEELFPSTPPNKELEYTVESDEDIRRRATAEADAERQKQAASTQAKYDGQIEKQKAQIESAEEEENEAFGKLGELYDELKKRTLENALKNGMGRSSTLQTGLENASEAFEEKKNATQREYAQKIASMNDKIQRLENEKHDALKAMDGAYATELENKIADMVAKRDKTVREYEKYNADVRAKNQKYLQEREQKALEYMQEWQDKVNASEAERRKFEETYGYSGAKADNYAKRYELAYDFYSALSPDIALEALEASPYMERYLGAYYNKLRDAMAARGEKTKTVY